MDDAIKVAMRKTQVEELKEKQRLCMEKFIEGNDVFASLPTGYGKSLIYCLLPETFNSLKGEHLTST